MFTPEHLTIQAVYLFWHGFVKPFVQWRWWLWAWTGGTCDSCAKVFSFILWGHLFINVWSQPAIHHSQQAVQAALNAAALRRAAAQAAPVVKRKKDKVSKERGWYGVIAFLQITAWSWLGQTTSSKSIIHSFLARGHGCQCGEGHPRCKAFESWNFNVSGHISRWCTVSYML